MSSRMLNRTDVVEYLAFPKSRNIVIKEMVIFQKLNNLVMNKPLVDFRQNRQYGDWSKIIVILRTIQRTIQD